MMNETYMQENDSDGEQDNAKVGTDNIKKNY